MDHMRTLGLLDSNGKPIAPHIERVLARLLPRLRRQFPALQDEVVLTEVMEEAGRRISEREERAGPIEKIHGYAWVAVRCVATSQMRRGSIRLVQNTLESEASQARIATVRATVGSQEQIERDILLREALAALSAEERRVCIWKKAGYSSQEIAAFQGRSVVAVDTLFSRAKQKIRIALSIPESKDDISSRPRPPDRRNDEPRPTKRQVGDETPDGTTRPTGRRR